MNTEKSTRERILKFIRSKKFIIAMSGVIIGASAGFMYYHFVGCSSGSCPITGNPYSSTLVGAVAGYLIAG